MTGLHEEYRKKSFVVIMVYKLVQKWTKRIPTFSKDLKKLNERSRVSNPNKILPCPVKYMFFLSIILFIYLVIFFT